jgi:hypothetical protein
MAKTKLQAAKDAVATTNRLIRETTHLMEICENELGQDHGLTQVLALLKLTQEDLMVELYFMGGAPSNP